MMIWEQWNGLPAIIGASSEIVVLVDSVVVVVVAALGIGPVMNMTKR